MTNSKKMNPQKLKDTLLKYALYIILLLLLVVIVAIKPNFLSVGNLISILKRYAICHLHHILQQKNRDK